MAFSALRRRAVHALKNYLRRDWVIEDMINLDEISPFIRLHLCHFYFSLMCVSASSAIGSFFHPTENIGSLFALFAASASFICFSCTAPWRENKRLCLLMLGACFGWATVTPWFSWLFYVDTGLVVTIISASFLGFACFWISAKWGSIFETMYFHGMLLCFPVVTGSMYFTANVFGGYSAELEYLLYSCNLWCLAYLAGFSQEVVVRARKGDGDYVKHAICLYTDSPAFLIHLTREIWRLRR